MLHQAIMAGLPIITCRTTDTINLGQILSFISDGACRQWQGKVEPEAIYFAIGTPDGGVSPSLYSRLVDAQSILIIINPDDSILEGFDAGELPTPPEIVRNCLGKVVAPADIPTYERAVAGLTIKQLVEVLKLTEVQYGYLDPSLMVKVRSQLTGKMQGLAPVDTQFDVYLPDIKLSDWLIKNSNFFLDPKDPRLIPRGILLDGPPGVGKTQGAKYIAGYMKVPLYRLDLASSLGRYVGESESNLTRALSTIDQEEPCVLLIDEVEKLFTEKEDNGVTTRLLAQLLWWLQEHKTRVLSVMTTNDSDKLPKELYRSGRIDDVFVISPPSPKEASMLIDTLINGYPTIAKKKKAIGNEIKGRYHEGMSHADIVALTKDVIKAHWSQL